MSEAVILPADDTAIITITTGDIDVVLPTIVGGSGTIDVLGDYVSPSAVARFTWSPPSASATWLIPHNLGYRPQVTLLDGSLVQMFAEVQHLSNNVVSVSFSSPTLGTAELI